MGVFHVFWILQMIPNRANASLYLRMHLWKSANQVLWILVLDLVIDLGLSDHDMIYYPRKTSLPYHKHKYSAKSFWKISDLINYPDFIYRFRGGSRTVATSKMERFVIIVNGFQTLAIITKRSNLNVAAVLDPPLRFEEVTNFLQQRNTSEWKPTQNLVTKAE